MELFWQDAQSSTDERLAGIAGKAVKEMAYHIRHCGEWIIRLGDGTPESHQRMNAAVEELHRYTDELFTPDEMTEFMVSEGVVPDPARLKSKWDAQIQQVFSAATLVVPEKYWPVSGGRLGNHSEAMGYLLADLQYMQRTYPGMTW